MTNYKVYIRYSKQLANKLLGINNQLQHELNINIIMKHICGKHAQDTRFLRKFQVCTKK